MNNLFKKTTLALALAAVSGLALADTAETKGGIKIKTDDGRFEATLGGRIHFDAYLFGDEKLNGADRDNNESGTEFRRARITLSGKAYGWEYKFEEDFAGSGLNSTVCTPSGTASGACTGGTTSAVTSTVTHRDMFVATKIGPGKLTIGQFKPYRSMEELTSSNEITMMERPFSSATGLYSNRQFQQGLGYLVAGDNYTAGLSGFTLRSDDRARNEGTGYAARVTFAPMADDGQVVHIGASYNNENYQTQLPGGQAITANYSGRRGDSEAIATIAAGDATDTIAAELAAVFGPFYLQAEYAMMTLDPAATGAIDQDIDSYYVMTSFNLTGESKPYKKGAGVFGSVKPSGEIGAFELTARYDVIENKDVAAKPEATAITAGLNWYVNPNVRFMLNYTMGETELVGAGDDEADQLAIRTQFSF